MKQLNLPKAELKYIKEGNEVKVWDIIRKKFVLLLPEEYVRQHIVHMLVESFKYPKGNFRVESGMSYNKMDKRTDLIIYDRNGVPFMLVECKSYDLKLNEKVLHQALAYNNEIRAPFIILSNGINTLILENVNGQLISRTDFPSYPS